MLTKGILGRGYSVSKDQEAGKQIKQKNPILLRSDCIMDYIKESGACLRENKYNEGIMGLVVTVF